MELETKALYNLIQFSASEDTSFSCEPWQKEDLRAHSTAQLFQKVQELGVGLKKEQLILYINEVESPEDLADCLLSEIEPESLQDQIYLILFELWKRLAPEKRSLSIFCDELDHLVFLYDHDLLKNDEPLQDALAELIEVLKESEDEGEETKGLLSRLNRYCSYDLETFVIEYILDQIHAGNDFYAAELLEGFYAYLSDDRWTDFLRVLLLVENEDPAADEEMGELIGRCKKHPSLSLQMEMLSFLSGNQSPDLFLQLAKNTLPLLEQEEELKEMLEMSLDYFRKLDQEEGEDRIEKMLEKRQAFSASAPLKEEDRKALLSCLESKG